jgi:hypothetical protein
MVVVEKADDDHYASISEEFAAGRIIPFLGAGANLADRGEEKWELGSAFLPNGSELAGHLIARGRYPMPSEHNLLRVSQYVEAEGKEGRLYRYLREVFDSEYRPTSLHKLLARVARYLDREGLPQLMLATTNYDDLLERALAEEGLEYDVVWYDARQNSDVHGRFRHRAPGKEPVAVMQPNEYKALPLVLERPAILKLHGCLDRTSPTDDSYVITEDSYIDYLSAGDIGALIPIALWNRMMTSSFLFLGYALSDWNLRVVLNRIWGSQKLVEMSWSIQREPKDPNASKIEQTLWRARKDEVALIFCLLSEYTQELEKRLPFTGPPADN